MIGSLPDDLPLTGGDVDQWCAGLTSTQRGIALVLAGVSAQALQAWSQEQGETGFLAWDADAVALGADPQRLLRQPHQRVLSTPPPERPVRQRLLRLEVSGNEIPPEVVPRLLEAPAVASVVLPAVRPPGALRRRRWRWPLRVGVPAPWAADELAMAVLKADLPAGGGKTHRLPERLVDIRDAGGEAAGVDVLLLAMPLGDAVYYVDAHRLMANAVVVLDRPSQAWPVVDAQLAIIRATTGAVATALGAPLPRKDKRKALATLVGRLVAEMSHSHPFDTALTIACERDVVIVGEPGTLRRTDLATSVDMLATALRDSARRSSRVRRVPNARKSASKKLPSKPADTRAAPPAGRYGPRLRVAPPPARSARPPRTILIPGAPGLDRAIDDLASLAEGQFYGERHEASMLPQALARVEALTHPIEEPRYLQATVGPAGQRNVLREGPNRVSVFIGPKETGAVRGPMVENRLLGFTSPEITTVRLTLVLIPLTPRGEPSRTEIDVPRFGRSDDAKLLLHVPPGRKRVEARLILLHRNRLVQTAVLKGTVGGSPVQLTQLVVVRPSMHDIEERRPFDAAFVLNHDSTGTSALIRHSNGHTWVESMHEIDATTDRMRRTLLTGAFLKNGGRGRDENVRKLMIELALDGNELFTTLEENLGELSGKGDPHRIQIVTARSGRFLPLEFVYPRVSPADDAKLCIRWQAGATACGPDCFASEDDDSVVCPAAFWGMSRTIERHYVDLTTVGPRFLVLAEPDSRRDRLTVRHALVGASTKVSSSAVNATVRLLDADACRVTTWEEWVQRLAAAPTDLLVLMPHSDPRQPSLEISTKVLRRARIENKHVTGDQQDVRPLVVLFGCDTAGSAEDPAGFATRFMQKRAAVVFSTLTMLYAPHAAALSQRLVTLLRDEGRKPMPLGDLIAQFRREAVNAGLVAALGVTAYGDADWMV